MKYYMKTLGEVNPDTEVVCCDPNFSQGDVLNAVTALNNEMVDENHPILGYCFCSIEFHRYAPSSTPVIVRLK